MIALVLYSLPACVAAQYNIRDYGAVGDGITDDTHAFTSAFTAASKAGGGSVVVPHPGSYVTGQFNLTSHTTFVVQTGAIVLGSTNHSRDYPVAPGGKKHVPWMLGIDVVNLTVTGGGVFDGQGWSFWHHTPSGMGPSRIPVESPMMFECRWCHNLTLRNVEFRNSQFWTIHPVSSTFVLIDQVTVTNPIDSPNTDCIDPDSVEDMIIRNSTLACGDDHVSIKAGGRTRAGKPMASQRVLVENCTLLHGQGLTIGSMVAHNVSDVTFRDISVVGSVAGIRFKAVRSLGGVVARVRYERVQFRTVGVMLIINLDYHHEPLSSTPPVVRDISLVNITGWGILASDAHCLPESPCKGFVLDNVLPKGSSEIVNDYICEHITGSTRGSISPFPRICAGLNETNAQARSVWPMLPRHFL